MKKYKLNFSEYLEKVFARPYSPINFLTNVYLVIIALGVMITSYLEVIYTESFSAKMDDSWCNPATQGIGKHCFSDFYSVQKIANSEHPWNGGSTYPPLPILIVRLFSKIGEENSKLRIILYLLSLIACFLILSVHIKKQNQNQNNQVVNRMLILLLSSSPFLMAIDRGNNVVVLFVLTYFIFHYTSQSRMQITGLLMVAAALIKPQMVIIFFFLLLRGRVKLFFGTASLYLVSNCSLFLFFSSDVLGNLEKWTGNLRGYQTYAGVPSLGNYSFANSLGLLKGTSSLLFGNQPLDEIFRPGLSPNTTSMLSAFYLFLIFSLLVMGRNKISWALQLYILTFSVVVVPGTSFGYYVLILLVPLIFITLKIPIRRLAMKEDPASSIEFFQVNRVSRFTLNVMFILVIPLWPLQWGMLNLPVKSVWANYGIVPTLAGSILWVIPLVLFTNWKTPQTIKK